MRWPAAPNCHGVEAKWLAARKTDSGGYRQCSYCMGVHPEDLIRLVRTNTVGYARWYNVHLLDVGYDKGAMQELLEVIRLSTALGLLNMSVPEQE